jgi:exoribonuclease II
MTDNRLDLTNLKVFTIDPPNSKDLDDALSVEKLENDHVRVGVHIADVTSLVEKDDAVDIEAQQRTTTFYPGECGRPYHTTSVLHAEFLKFLNQTFDFQKICVLL